MFRAGTFPSSLQGSEGSAGTTLPCIGSNVAGGDVRLKAHRDRGGRPGAVAPSRGLAGGSGCRVGRCGRWWRRHTMEQIMWRPGAIEGMASRALWIDKYVFLCERRRGHTRRAGGGVVPGRAQERVLSPCGHSTRSGCELVMTGHACLGSQPAVSRDDKCAYVFAMRGILRPGRWDGQDTTLACRPPPMPKSS